MKAGLDINRPEFGIILEQIDHTGIGGIHPNWNKEWADFFARNPNPSKSRVLIQLNKMRNDSRFKGILFKGVRVKIGYIKWQKLTAIAREGIVRKASRKATKTGLKVVTKKVVKKVPVLGLVFVVYDINNKGFSGGVCNSLLDACPAVGWGKLAAECIWGDWFPDKEGVQDD
jgi:hypothetical protein